MAERARNTRSSYLQREAYENFHQLHVTGEEDSQMAHSQLVTWSLRVPFIRVSFVVLESRRTAGVRNRISVVVVVVRIGVHLPTG